MGYPRSRTRAASRPSGTVWAFLASTSLGSFASTLPAPVFADPSVPFVDLGVGNGRLVSGDDRGTCVNSDLLLHSDGTYENGFSWRYGGVIPPDFGAFAEKYSNVADAVMCAAVFDFSTTGDYGADMTVFLWDDNGGIPGAVRVLKTNVGITGIAFWPEVSRHTIELDAALPSGSTWWVGYWGNWPGGVQSWFVGADLDGPGGEPRTKIAPGVGYPTGWQDVSIVWGPTSAIGIGAAVIEGDFGACCLEDGSCIYSEPLSCSGTFQGVETVCAPNPCPQPPVGACCFANGSCVSQDRFDCAEQDGSYLGDEISCSPNPCPQPALGACCLIDGTCLIDDRSDCEDLEGDYQGDGASCTPNPCPQPGFGACCLPGPVCLDRFDYQCDQMDGLYLGDGTACITGECPEICAYERPSPVTSRGAATSGAGPNAGGTLILHHNTEIEFTTIGSYCGLSQLENCWESWALVEVTVPVVFHALAAFPSGSSPRLSGLTFGINYPTCITILDAGSCGDLEIPDSNWPAAFTGTAVAWSAAQTTQLTEVYWFVAYINAAQPAKLDLIGHPDQGGFFGDDSVPSNLDPITDYGELGFFRPGYVPCPGAAGACCLENGTCLQLSPEDCATAMGEYKGNGTHCDTADCSASDVGACCLANGECFVMTQSACDQEGGFYAGGGTDCSIPCEPVPTIKSSWGEIKLRFGDEER